MESSNTNRLGPRSDEAWKLLGSSIRVAELLELHRDPGCRLWTDDEKYIRRLAWNNLVMWDRFYSSLLSYPSMNLSQFSDVIPEFSNYSDGSFPALSALHDLSFLAESINQLYLGRDPLHSQNILALDYQIDQWARTNNIEVSSENEGPIKNLSQIESPWYPFLKMKLYAVKPIDHNDIQEKLTGSASPPPIDKKNCADLCIELIQVQCAAHDTAAASEDQLGHRNFLSYLETNADSLFMLLEASATLLLHIEHRHWSQRIATLLERVCGILLGLSSRHDGNAITGNMSYIGLSILQAFLRRWHREGDIEARGSSLSSTTSLLTLSGSGGSGPNTHWTSFDQSYEDSILPYHSLSFDTSLENMTLF